LAIPLWQRVRASTAAPTYFPPEVFTLDGRDVVFVDGALTTYNNRAFQLFLMATHDVYRLCWTATESDLLRFGGDGYLSQGARPIARSCPVEVSMA
jgi:hypothetical protein